MWVLFSNGGEAYSIRLVPIGGIGKEALRLGINNTKILLEMSPCPYSGSGRRRMVGTRNIHLVRTLYTRITIEDCWSAQLPGICGRWGQRNF